MKITIDNVEIELKYTLKAFMAYEQLMEKSFEPKGLSEIILIFYCMAVTNGAEVDFDKFVSFLDEQPTLITEFTEWFAKQGKFDEQMSPKSKTKGSKKK